MHSQRTPLVVVCDCLDHGAKDIGIDLGPVQTPDVKEVGSGDTAKVGYIEASGKQPAIDVRESGRPARHIGIAPLVNGRVHRLEKLANYLMRIRGISITHLFDSCCK